MYQITNIQEGNELELAGATATICKDGIAIGTVEDLGDGGELEVNVGEAEFLELQSYALKSFASVEAFLEDLIQKTVN